MLNAMDRDFGLHEACPVRAHAVAFLFVLAIFVVGVRSTEAHPTSVLRVGLVADATVLNDRTAGHSIYLGLRRAVKELRVRGRVLTPSPKEGFGPSIAYLARQGYDVVIVAAFEPSAVVRAARAFPHTTFVIPDQTFPRHLRNIRSLIFREEQVGFLVGYLAALMEKQRPGRNVLGSVGGGRSRTVDSYIAGFRAGARAADPTVFLLNGYSNDFVDSRRCRGVASRLIARGARAVFAVAGNCGFGALQAARAGHVWGIGADTDQSYLGPHVLTSAVKREDVAVLDTIRALQHGSMRGGGTSIFTLGNGGLQLGRMSPGVPAKVVAAVDRMRKRIVAGRIRIPTGP
jgi:basic membrane protein A and related proteins